MNSRYKIDRRYYKRCLQTAEKIKAYVEEVMADDDLMQDILSTNGVDDLKTDFWGKYNYRVVIFMLYDIWKCYVGMGYDDKNANEIPMLSYSMVTFMLAEGNSISRLSNGILAEDIRELEALQATGKQMMKTVRVMEPQGFEGSTAFLMMLYYNRLGRGQREYLYFLHDVAETMASSKGYIPPKAQRYLDKLKSEVTSFPEPAESISETKSSEEVSTSEERKGLEELDELIGLCNVKSEIKKLSSFVQVQQWRIKEGLKVPVVSYHCVFTGNPGTPIIVQNANTAVSKAKNGGA